MYMKNARRLKSSFTLQEQECLPSEDIRLHLARRITISRVFQLSRQGKWVDLWVDSVQCTIHGEGVLI